MNRHCATSLLFPRNFNRFYWDGGRPARHEHRQVRVISHNVQLHRLFAALSAGGTPAVPVKHEDPTEGLS
jgi:hypothetical protein